MGNKKVFAYLLFLVMAFTINANTVFAKSISGDGQSIETTREVSLQLEDDNQSLKEINEIINNIEGGYIVSVTENERYANYIFKVPKDEYDNTIKEILTLGKLVDDRTVQNNLGFEIIELETKIDNNKQYVKVVMDILKQANDLETMLKLEQYLVNAETEQTNNQNWLNELKEKTNYVTVNLHITKYYDNNEDVLLLREAPFTKKLANAFKTSYNSTVYFILNIFVIVSYLVIPISVVLIVTFIVLRIKKRGKNYEKK